MKFLTTISLLFISCLGHATVLEFKFSGEIYKGRTGRDIDISQFNQKLKKLKLPQLPETIVWGTSSYADWKKTMRKIGHINKALKREVDVVFNHGYLYEFPPICYRGEVSDVPELIESMMGSVLHSDQDIQALRFARTKIVHTRSFFEMDKKRSLIFKKENPNEFRAWTSFNVKSQDLLVLSDIGPGDAQVNVTHIRPCDQSLLQPQRPGILIPAPVISANK